MIIAGLLLFIPISLLLAYGLHAAPLWVFVTAGLGIIPVADWIRRATSQLAARTGPAIGGLVNVTFGSVAELILALFVLSSGHTTVVKAQITGSLIGTSLLGLGIAIVAGGVTRPKLTFQRERAGSLGSLLILGVIALILPAVFDYNERHLFPARNTGTLDENLSIGVSVVLILVYAANLVYTLITRRDIFESLKSPEPSTWTLRKCLAILVGGTVLIAVEASLISSSLQATADSLALSPLFLGVIVLAIIGNAAEIIAATYFARQNRMDLVMGLCLGSSIQVALLLAPALVLISHFLGHPMSLIFSNPLELIAIVGMVFVVNSIAADGETTWFEGVLLVAVYVLLGIAFYFATP